MAKPDIRQNMLRSIQSIFTPEKQTADADSSSTAPAVEGATAHIPAGASPAVPSERESQPPDVLKESETGITQPVTRDNVASQVLPTKPESKRINTEAIRRRRKRQGMACTFYVSFDLIEKLEKLQKAGGVPQSAVVEEALRRYFESGGS